MRLLALSDFDDGIEQFKGGLEYDIPDERGRFLVLIGRATAVSPNRRLAVSRGGAVQGIVPVGPNAAIASAAAAGSKSSPAVSPGLMLPSMASLQSALPNLMQSLRTYDDSSPATIRVFGLGSSVGAGATLPTASTQAPSAKFYSLLSQRVNRLGNITLAHTNGSVNGTTITDANLTDYAAAKTTAGGTPKVVFCAYGMNDGMSAQYHAGQTYSGVYSSLATLLGTVAGDGADLVLTTTPHPHSTRTPWTTAPGSITYPPGGVQIPTNTYAASVISGDFAEIGTNVPASYRHLRTNQAIRQFALDNGLLLIDVERYWFRALAYYGENALFDAGEYAHPNLLGHQASYWAAIEDTMAAFARAGAGFTPGTLKPEVFLYKVGNSTRTTTTLADDSQLSFYAGPNTVWEIDFNLYFAAPAASDARFWLNIPSGTTGKFAVMGPATTASSTDNQEGIHRSAALEGGGYLTMGSISADSYGRVRAFAKVGSTGGSITLQYALASAGGGTLTMYGDSSLRARRVA